ncbi:MAG: tRNA (adenosine(37)-N6)-threonylcarbamoyltransferase complex dimerization subunit type 1 TsaB [Pseudomonadota bacterium]
MRVLAIETASESCSVALFEDKEVLASEHRVLGRDHAEQLVPMIARLPRLGRADRILVSLGPGSFTGVRIGLATARALGLVWHAKALGYSTLRLINEPSRQRQRRAATICVNGGHGEWFVQNFAASGEAETDLLSLRPLQVADFPVHGTIVGNRARECLEIVQGDRSAIDQLPDARQTFLLSASQLTSDLRPIYGRAPDAEPQKMSAKP